MAQVVLDNISCRYDTTVALDRISLTIPSGQFLTLLGPSGCGKSTTLRVIAGLLQPSGGRVLFEGATSSYAHSEGRLVACVGTSNIVVVETADAVLVADRSHVQDIKGLVSRIRAEKSPEADAHRKVRRPWEIGRAHV